MSKEILESKKKIVDEIKSKYKDAKSVIFVNYDGKQKHRIRVCDGAFIGSNCNLIAPLTIAEKSYICAGTTVTQSTEKEDFVIGRVRPTTKPGRGGRYLK